MPRMTSAEYGVWQAKECARLGRSKTAVEDRAAAEIGGHLRECELHDQIMDHCRRVGWYVVHSRMDRATTTKVGCPDFVIALPGGKTLWVECKVGSGKLSQPQQAAAAWLKKLGHNYLIIRSYESFIESVASVERVGVQGLREAEA